MQLKISNLDKPSNRNYKRIADILLYTLPLYQGAILALPIDEEVKLWVGGITTIVVVTIKALTKFTTDEIIVPQ